MNLTIQKGQLYTDGQTVGTVTDGGKALPARIRVFPERGNLIAVQTYFPISDAFPTRSDWASHPKEWVKARGGTDEQVQFISPMSSFTALGWTDDERHDSKGKADSVRLEGQNPDASLQFRIKEDGTVEIVKNTTSDEQALVNKYRQAAQQTSAVQTEAQKLKEEKEKMTKWLKIGGFSLLGLLVLGAGVYFYQKSQEENEGESDDKGKGKGKGKGEDKKD
jgi:hypothetical protein